MRTIGSNIGSNIESRIVLRIVLSDGHHSELSDGSHISLLLSIHISELSSDGDEYATRCVSKRSIECLLSEFLNKSISL